MTRLRALVFAGALLGGCGSSQPGAPPADASPDAPPATSPACQAVAEATTSPGRWCEDDPILTQSMRRPPFCRRLTVTGVGWQDHEGKVFHLYTRHQRTGEPLAYGTTVIRDGRFRLEFPYGFGMESYQPFWFFVDGDGDGRCTAAAADHVGMAFTNAGAGDLAREIAHDAWAHTDHPESPVCLHVNTCPPGEPR